MFTFADAEPQDPERPIFHVMPRQGWIKYDMNLVQKASYRACKPVRAQAQGAILCYFCPAKPRAPPTDSSVSAVIPTRRFIMTGSIICKPPSCRPLFWCSPAPASTL